MLDWLVAPIDAARAHHIDGLVAWHARIMVMAWGVLIPLGIVAARFFKVTPGQDWPRQLDNTFWWNSHRALQYSGGVLMLAGLAAVLIDHRPGFASPHALLGWPTIALGLTQFISAWLRGSKGGPTDEALRGDHYDMTRRRILFEHAHKTLGYVAAVAAIAAILSGLWQANAPRWMWLVLILWWGLLALAFATFQRRGMALDTYQAIWGPEPHHPGNHRAPIGWWVRRR